jgi:hypothetical protein
VEHDRPGIPGRLIRSSVRALDDDETKRLVARLLGAPEVRDATRALVASAADGMLDALEDDERAAKLGAATGRRVRDELRRALRCELDDRALQERLAVLAHDAARHATLGMQAALEEVAARRNERIEQVHLGLATDERAPLVRQVDALSTRVGRLARWGSAAAAMGAVVVLGWVVSRAVRAGSRTGRASS